MALQLAKMIYAHDMELLNPELDWIGTCKMHFLWWKPELNVRFSPREIEISGSNHAKLAS